MSDDWAEKAFSRFQQEAGDQRRLEEIEILREQKKAAFAQTRWDEFYAAVRRNVDKFNRLAGREFLPLALVDSGHFYINAPKLSIVVTLNLDEPSIRYGYSGRTPAGTEQKGGGRFEFTLDNGEVWMLHNGTRVTAEQAAEIVLDRLVS
jgi:hypothetical protein